MSALKVDHESLLRALMRRIDGSQSPPENTLFDEDLDLIRLCMLALASNGLFRFASCLYGNQVNDPPLVICALLNILRDTFLEVGVTIRENPPKTLCGAYFWLLYESRVLEMQGPGVRLRPSFEEDALVWDVYQRLVFIILMNVNLSVPNT